MPWRAITSDNITGRMTQTEQAMLAASAGVASRLQERLTDSIRKFIGAMSAANYPVNTDDTVPDQLRNHVMADAIWEWLKDFPNLKAFQTDQRKKAAADAQTNYEKICARTYGALEAPAPGTDFSIGNWNSENKILMRTHPTPSPAQQFQVNPFTSPQYANPNAEPDAVTVVISDPPTDLQATAGAKSVTLTWLSPSSATSYKIYRGTATNAETVPALATVTGAGYTDTAVVSGTPYFYKVTAVNAAGESPLSGEATATPT